MNCSTQCGRPATMALRTLRPNRDDLHTIVYYDEAVAPRTAQRYCTKHGLATLIELVAVLVPGEVAE